MTLEHSDLQTLFEKLTELIELYRNDPAALEVILSELKGLYRRIPIYPGIITKCLLEVVQPVDVKEVRSGSEISLLLRDDRVLAGRVLEVGSDQLKLTGGQQFEPQKSLGEIPIPVRDIREVRLFTRDVLEKKKEE
jgi:hypothetical protein